MYGVILIFVILAGLCFGSFVTLASFRLPRGEDIVLKPSRCPVCNTPLKARDMFPVLSWCLRPTCRACKTRIHWRYPAIEIVTALAFALIYFRWGITPQSLLLALLAVALLIMIVADFEHYIIPDVVLLVLLPAGILYQWLLGASFLGMIYGAALGLGIGFALHYGYKKLRKKDGLGWGDVKFLGLAGLWLGLLPLAPFLFLSGLFGIITGLGWRAVGRGKLFPFGPALALALFICVVFPEAVEAFWHLQKWVYP